MRDVDTAWVAGIVEGEGSIFLRCAGRRGQRNVPHIKVAMNDEDVVRRLAALTGMGRICSTTNRSGTIAYQWQSSDRTSVPALLRELRPWMGARRCAQIDTVVAAALPYGWDGTRRSRPDDWSRSDRVVVIG